MTDLESRPDNQNGDSTVAPTESPTHTNGIKQENGDGFGLQNGTNGHITENEDKKRNVEGDDAAQHASKRRKVTGMPRSGLQSRRVSPPWQFGEVKESTLQVDGKRRSARATAPSSPAVQSEAEEKRPRRESASKHRPSYKALNNGKSEDAKNAKQAAGHKRMRSAEKVTAPPTFKKPAKPAKRSDPPSSPKTHKRVRSTSSATLSSDKTMPSSPIKTNARRSSRRTETAPRPTVNDAYGPMPQVDTSSSKFQKLRLKVREPKLGRTHPSHWPAPKKHASFQEWLDNDDPLEGETDVPLNDDSLQKEIAARLRLARASEPGGILTEGRCTRFLEGEKQEPPLRYGTWDHVCAHASNFRKLLRMEKEKHKKWAKQLAQSCQLALATEARWAKVRERKSKEQVELEERGYQIRRYRQLVKDVGGAWELARNEVNNIRFKQWEQEQEALGKKALDEMLDQSTALLYQHRMRDSSELPSEEGRSSIGPTGSETGTGLDDSDRDRGSSDSDSDADSSVDSENMSESSEDEDEPEAAGDDDANLSPEALRRKYAAALDQSLHSDASESADEDDADDEDDEDDHSGSQTEEEETAASSEDEDEDDEQGDSLTSLLLPKSSRPKIAETTEGDQPAEVDSKMDLTEDHATPASENDGPPPDLEDVDDILMDRSSDESTDMDDEDSDEGSGTEGSEEEESEEEGPGLMGFFASSKKAKAVSDVNDDNVEDSEIKEDDAESGAIEEDMEVDEEVQSDSVRRSRSQPSTPHTPMEIPKTEVPSLLLRGSLREYQHDGLDWLAKLYDGSRNGILADEMGLGKTIQTISLLAHLAVNHKVWGPHLVVVPTSVMLNWEMEFKKWLPGFKILTYYGDIEERKRKRQGWLDDNKWNVCIASYQLILKDAQAFKKRSWHYLILDEAHYIKNFQSQKWQTLLTFKTHSRLLLTGTPLQNDLQELWSLLYFLMPAGLDGSGGFADLEKFLSSMKRPADQILNQGQQKLDAEAQARVNKLHEVLRPFLLRRLKSEVEKQMPGKYEHVVYCRLSKRQRQLYDEFMSRSDTKRTLSSGNYMSIMNCLMSLRKVCNHPDLFETRQIVTSYAMPKSAVAHYEIKELFVRRRLLRDEDKVNLEYVGLIPAAFETHSRLSQFRRYHLRALEPFQGLVARQSKRLKPRSDSGFGNVQESLNTLEHDAEQSVLDTLKNCVTQSQRTTDQWPIYGTDFISLMMVPNRFFPPPRSRKKLLEDQVEEEKLFGPHGVRSSYAGRACKVFEDLIPTVDQVAERCNTNVQKFACLTPAVVAEDVVRHALTPAGMQLVREAQALTPFSDPYHEARIRTSIAFPDKRLLQYDCGKLQALDKLLRDLQSGGHRCLIFTQMTKVLDLLEQFLNIHGHRYLRLDGSTKIEQRQILTDRFNNDKRILAFILSSRSGGLGINLTGADTVIFYDLDWNPAMDAQCQDRCHRIGQTRDVHIYRFVSEHTIEANILRKSNQKRLLDDVIIQKGEFTSHHFNRVTYKDAFADTEELAGEDAEASAAMDRVLGEVTGLGTVLDSVEDKEDAAAAKEAQKEAIYNADENDFNDSNAATGAAPTRDGTTGPVDEVAKAAKEMEDEEKGRVDEWMVRFLNEYDMKGLPVVLPKAVVNAKRNARNAKKGREAYRRRR